MSALDFEEAGHKLMKIQVDPGREIEVVTMILECCSQEKTYIRCAPLDCDILYIVVSVWLTPRLCGVLLSGRLYL